MLQARVMLRIDNMTMRPRTTREQGQRPTPKAFGAVRWQALNVQRPTFNEEGSRPSREASSFAEATARQDGVPGKGEERSGNSEAGSCSLWLIAATLQTS
jgi:hypothetical protein